MRNVGDGEDGGGGCRWYVRVFLLVSYGQELAGGKKVTGAVLVSRGGSI